MMRTRTFVLLSAILSLGLPACGSDDDGGGSGGTAGSGATGGMAGSGGASGSGGMAGMAGSGGTAGSGGMAGATSSFKVKIENVSGSSALPSGVSPTLLVLHTAPNPFFEVGKADPGLGLESVAEDGDPSALVTSLTTAGMTAMAVDTPVGKSSAGPALPGDSFEAVITAHPGDKLSLAAMYGQSNDTFIGDDGSGIALFDGSGAPLAAQDVTSQIALWNAGTERDEAPGFGGSQAPRQAAPNTGPAEGVVAPRTDPTRALPVASAIANVTVSESGGTFTITMENVSKAMGVAMSPISPAFYATHDSSWSLFTLGNTAPAGLENLAEDGDPSMLVTANTGASGIGEVDSAGSLTLPGASLSFSVTPTAAAPMLSFASMVGQTNDTIVGTPPEGVALMDAGTARPAADVQADIMRTLSLWDVGTEMNEAPGVGPNQAPRQAAPNTGPADPNDKVRRYSDTTNDWDATHLSKFAGVTIKNAGGLKFDVTVENVSANTAFVGLISPVAWAIHDATASMFKTGMPASPGLEALAEDGKGTTLLSELSAMSGVMSSGSEGSGPIMPGNSVTFQVTADASHRFLSIASMAVPSNDTFLSLGEGGIALLDGSGAARSDTDIANDVGAQLAAWDAGTEQNQGSALGPDMAGPGLQSGPNMGASEGDGTVRASSSDLWPLPAASSVVKVTIEPM